ncbi:kinase-like protein [Punctularia strigosozonata HHB-11173 SS5]|uniref:Kinase-like protein n=1 Tax=Punctularia strigosozonata (strain HHB-11173) TaxID=741275 RepID=R7S0B8_PUNST|nr:kinase-like protein [Punctularia strigosozonata HHB-11173 SS5]EIN03830.1 kinase-like protein [Punctularia strigosozonata HHB-11173 SS5]
MLAKADTTHFARAGLSVAKDFADLSGISYLAPAIGTLDKILDLCDKVDANKKAAIALCEHCFRLMIAIHRKTGAKPIDGNSDMGEAVLRLNGIVQDAHGKLQQILCRRWWQMFTGQRSIEDEIAQYHDRIASCLDEFQLIAVLDAREQGQERELLQRIADQRTQQKLDEIGRNTVSIQTRILSTETKTSELVDFARVAAQEHKYQSEVLVNIQESLSGSGLAVMRVGASTIRRQIEAFSMSCNGALENFRGVHTERGEVVVKRIHQCKMSDKVKRRFIREIDVWKAVYEVDSGEHIVPFWGYGQDGDHPFVFSPYFPEGSIMEYIEKHGNAVDRMQLVRSLAQAIRVLHNMDIVHGNIQVAQCCIDTSTGSPKVLLSDFGLTKMMVDNIVEFTDSRGYEITRWAAPEVLAGNASKAQIYSTPADVYAFGMTILEVMTGQHPYSNYNAFHLAFLAKMMRGELPPQPTEPEVVANGLDDSLWSLLLDCWQTDPTKRPTIDEVIARL